MNIIIRPIEDADSLEALTELLHRAYSVRLVQGFRFVATYQDVNTTRDRIKGGHCFLALVDGEIVGTATVYPPGRDARGHYGNPGVWKFGQFGVLPEFAGKGIGRTLFNKCTDTAKLNGGLEIVLDTPENAAKLIEIYTRWGFRPVGKIDFPDTNYISTQFAKPLT